ncbi:MAG: N-acetylneuraminate synthase family protein [Termitinemataceae bacterium]|nr:MAG: N-acetylneuraminate synthase family protein [Termitinemataceae bacterium]
MFTRTNPFIIAELGTSHNGDIVKAKELIDAAAESGADCIKVQIIYADEILHPNTGIVPLPNGNTRLYDVFKKLELPFDFYREIKEYTENKNTSLSAASDRNLQFLATAFGQKSLSELKTLNPKIVKVASPELNYVQLLNSLAMWNVDVLLSTGVSKLSDIETALSYFECRSAAGLAAKNVYLLHCITAYPAPEEQYNLNVMRNLTNIFGVPCGVSDHSLDPVLVPLLSLACGGCVIEKHFCLSRTDDGIDDKVALDPKDFSKMVSAVRDVQHKTENEILIIAQGEYSKKKVAAVLGTGIKNLASAEAENYTRTNRSVHALIEIKTGSLITKENSAILRTEKVLRPGMPPIFYDKILGKSARSDIPAGEGIRFCDV